MPCAINVEDSGAVGAVNMERLNLIAGIIDRTIEFIDQVYLPDLLAIASFYKDWTHGGGLSRQAVLSYGDIPEHANDDSAANQLLPRGAIIDGNLHEVHDVDLADPAQIQEFVTHSWFRYPDEQRGLHPWDGITEPHFVLGPKTQGDPRRIEALDEGGKYSWVKAPRWRGHAMEVGPLARWIVGYAKGIPEFKEPVDKTLTDLGLPFEALFSALGRTAARGLEASWAAHKMRYFHEKLIARIKAGDTATANAERWEPRRWPRKARGAGSTEAPRGALGHWVTIADGKIEHYQAVVPTTWNASPRDPAGRIGAYEAALLGVPVAKADEPLEILRVLHSFDPCLACAAHLLDPTGRELTRVTVC